MTSTITLRDAVEMIGRADEAELDVILTAYKNRVRTARADSAVKALAEFDVGDTVSLSELRPKYLVGLTGTITARKDDKFVVTFDEMSEFRARRFGSTVTVPASCVTAVG